MDPRQMVKMFEATILGVVTAGITEIAKAQTQGALTAIAKASAKKGNTPSWQINNPANDCIEQLIQLPNIGLRLGATQKPVAFDNLDLGQIMLNKATAETKAAKVNDSQFDEIISLLNENRARIVALEGKGA